MRILGFIACAGIMVWIMDSAAGIAAFLDAISLAIVFGGGLAFAVAKGGLSQSRNQALLNFAQGAVYWGWLGLLVGCVGIAANLKEISALGPAAAIAILTVFYGYTVKWTVVAILGQGEA
jgi:flagellar motor component MotA